MIFGGKSTEMPGPDEALPGRTGYPFAIPEAHRVLGNPLREPFPDGVEVAYFAMGCFWGAERLFWQKDGVFTTAVGYQNGFTPYPTYEEVCSGRTGHAESVLVAFRPDEVSYRELVGLFFSEHDPTQGMRQGNDVGTQYRSGIFFSGPEQEEIAIGIRDRYEADLDAGHGDDRAGTQAADIAGGHDEVAALLPEGGALAEVQDQGGDDDEAAEDEAEEQVAEAEEAEDEAAKVELEEGASGE
jgi:peptide-methionine (S)-S-oxide reductase